MGVDSNPNSEYYTIQCLVQLLTRYYRPLDVTAMFMMTSAQGPLDNFHLLNYVNNLIMEILVHGE